MDISFLRILKNDFNKVKLNDNFITKNIIENRCVQLLPSETMLQITNCSSDIAFGGNVLIELVNCSDEVKYTFSINEDFYYYEFTDIKGIRQIAFEFGYLGVDFQTELLFIKFSQPLISSNVWYSAPFTQTYYQEEYTTKFYYSHQGYFNGVSYDVVNYFQSVRLKSYDNDRDWKIKNDGYTELDGDEVSFRQINTKITKGLFDRCNIFTIDRIVSMFSHNLLFINGYKCNNKPNFKKDDILGTSNFFSISYDYNPSEQEITFDTQLFQKLDALSKTPSGLYSIISYNLATTNSTIFSIPFNKSIEFLADISLKVYKNGVLFETFDASTFSVVGQTLNIDVSGTPITDSADYTCVIESGKIKRNAEYFKGFPYGEWTFSILDAEYDGTQYDNSQYITN